MQSIMANMERGHDLSERHDAAKRAADPSRYENRKSARRHKGYSYFLFHRVPEEAEQDGETSDENQRKKENVDEKENGEQNLAL